MNISRLLNLWEEGALEYVEEIQKRSASSFNEAYSSIKSPLMESSMFSPYLCHMSIAHEVIDDEYIIEISNLINDIEFLKEELRGTITYLLPDDKVYHLPEGL